MRALVRLILTLFGLVAIGGGAAGGWYLYKHVEKMQYESGNPAFLDLEPMNITIIKEGVPTEIRTYWLTIESREGTPMGKILAQRTALAADYYKYLTALAGRAGPENIDNEPYVKTQLMLASKELLAPKAEASLNPVKAVLIRRIQFRDMQFD
ncbi:hypothetical protein ACFSM5_09330 [Lacibacterium aquatile]|uniref:Flagellar protein FliL n=1 Tax=Lacibacterium aquatile TaxID=1168082 RepID=A0ABW5DT02_9PROT